MSHSTALVNELNAAKRLILKHFGLVVGIKCVLRVINWLAREFTDEIRQILAELRLKKSNWPENRVLLQKPTSLKPGSGPQAFPPLHPGSSLNLSTGKIFNAQPQLAFKSRGG